MTPQGPGRQRRASLLGIALTVGASSACAPVRGESLPALVVAPQLAACSLPGSELAPVELALNARVELAAGTFPWPRSGPWDVPLFARVLAGPEGTPATPAGPISVQRTTLGPQRDGVERLQLAQVFDLDGRELRLELEVRSPREGGRVQDAAIDAYSLLVPSTLALTATWSADGGPPRTRAFGSCGREGYAAATDTVVLANGDRVVLERKSLSGWCDAYRPLATRSSALVRARWTSGEHVREVDDPLELVWTTMPPPGPGSWTPEVLVRFGPPVGQRAALVLLGPDTQEFEFAHYRNPAGDVVEMVYVVSTTHDPAPITCETPGLRY